MANEKVQGIVDKYAKRGTGKTIPLSQECLESYTYGETVKKVMITRPMSSLPSIGVCEDLRLSNKIAYGTLIGSAFPCAAGWLLHLNTDSIIIVETGNNVQFLSLMCFNGDNANVVGFDEIFLGETVNDRTLYAEPNDITCTPEAMAKTQEYYDQYTL